MSHPVQLYHTRTGERLIVYRAQLARHLMARGCWSTQPPACPVDAPPPACPAHSPVAAAGLDPDVVQLLVLHGIRTKADIRRRSDAQLLRLRGVCAADVQVLRAWAAA